VTRAAEALQGLKPQELRALWLRMEGRTYKEIAADLGWTYTKVNRCVTEGRRAFLKRYAGIESGEECRRMEPAISAFVDGELDGQEISALRRHLRGCGGCRGTLRSLRSGQRSLQAILPVGLVVSGDGGDSALGLVVRVYETVIGTLQERAATLALKAQFAVEATGAGKVAAVAGAAAAVAGGGAATVDRITGEEVPQPAARTEARARAVVTTVPSVAPSTPAAVRAAPIVVRRTPARAPARTETSTAPEFAFERAEPERQSQPAARPARAGGEFDLEP
jgi:hypothetical protein